MKRVFMSMILAYAAAPIVVATSEIPTSISGTYQSDCRLMGFDSFSPLFRKTTLIFTENTLETKTRFFHDTKCAKEINDEHPDSSDMKFPIEVKPNPKAQHNRGPFYSLKIDQDGEEVHLCLYRDVTSDGKEIIAISNGVDSKKDCSVKINFNDAYIKMPLAAD